MPGSGLPLGRPRPAALPSHPTSAPRWGGGRGRTPKNLEPPVLSGMESPRCRFESRVPAETWTPALCPTRAYQKVLGPHPSPCLCLAFVDTGDWQLTPASFSGQLPSCPQMTEKLYPPTSPKGQPAQWLMQRGNSPASGRPSVCQPPPAPSGTRLRFLFPF